MSIGIRQKDPSAKLNFTLDWAKHLTELGGLTITASTWIVPTGITQDAVSFTSTTATIRLSGGTDGQDYEVVNHVTLSDGQEDERSLTIQVRQAEAAAGLDTDDRSRALAELLELAQLDIAPVLTLTEIESILDKNKRASTWIANTAYLAGDVVQPSSRNGRRYRCEVGGTSGATNPFADFTGEERQIVVRDGSDLMWIEDGPEYENIYDVRQAAYECWRLRRSKAAHFVSAEGVEFQQVFEHCALMMESFGSLG